jgi:hypothetical protein
MMVRRFGVLALLLTLGQVSTARADEIAKEAREHFNAGVAFVDDPDGARYEEAYREFKAAYAISPSWKILGNMGLVALKLERDGEAIEAYSQYLEQGGAQIEAGERRQVERDLQILKNGLVNVTLSSVPAGATVRDERFPDAGPSVVNRYVLGDAELTLGLHPGRHRLIAHLDGYREVGWTLDAKSGTPASNVFQLEKLEEQQPGSGVAAPPPIVTPPREKIRPVPVSVYILGGISVALAGGGVVTGLIAKSKHDDFDAANANITSQTEQENAKTLRDDGQRLNLIADSLFAGAVIGAGVTTVLFLTRPTVEREQGRVRLLPIMGQRTGGAMLSGSF